MAFQTKALLLKTLKMQMDNGYIYAHSTAHTAQHSTHSRAQYTHAHERKNRIRAIGSLQYCAQYSARVSVTER